MGLGMVCESNCTVAVYPKDGPVCETKKKPPLHICILNNIEVDT